jgi:hypothetical protein
VNEKMGLWIQMNNNDSLEMYGMPINSSTFYMEQRFNLIGYPSLVPRNVSSIFSNVTEFSVFSFDDGMWYSYDSTRPIFLNTLKMIKPAYGYWIKAKQNITLIINNTIH